MLRVSINTRERMNLRLKNTIRVSQAKKLIKAHSDSPGGFIVLVIKHNQSPALATALTAALPTAVQTATGAGKKLANVGIYKQ